MIHSLFEIRSKSKILMLNLILTYLPLTDLADVLNPDHLGLRKKLLDRFLSKCPRDLVSPFPKWASSSIKKDCLCLQKGWKKCVKLISVFLLTNLHRKRYYIFIPTLCMLFAYLNSQGALEIGQLFPSFST